MKRTLGLIPVFLLMVVLTACGDGDEQVKKTPPKPVKAMIVGELVENLSREFTGKVLATTTAELSFEVSGRLIELPVVEGSEKKKGELLAKIDPTRYQANLKDAQAKYDLTKAQFKRGKQLIVQKFISENEFDVLRSNMNQAKAALDKAQKNLNDTVLHAPFDGFVAKKYVDNFEYIKAKEPVLAFHDVDYMDIEIQLPEYIVLQVKKGKDIKSFVIFDQVNKEYALTFKEFSSRADADTQTYRTVYKLKAPKGINVLPGMSVTVKLVMPDYKNNQQNFYLVPSSAVFSGPSNKPHVWVIDAKTQQVKPQLVKVANMSGDKIKILSGLSKGEQIVTAGVHFIRQGQKVRPIMDKK